MTTVVNNIGVTPATFIQDFPEFGNQSAYPPAVIAYYLALANILLNPVFWGGPSPNALPQGTPVSPPQAMIDFAAELFVAHNLVLEYAAQRAAATGGLPGTQTGPVASKGVGPISVSYDNGAAAFEAGNAGDYTLTTYGQRLWRMIQMAGAGPIQLGLGVAPPWSAFTPSAFGPWGGPPIFPGWYWNT
jgi:hypothetical protein